MEKRLSIKDTLVYAFKTAWSRLWYLLGLTLLSILLYGVNKLLMITLPMFLYTFFSSAIMNFTLKITLIVLCVIVIPFLYMLFCGVLLQYMPLKLALRIYDNGIYGVSLKEVWHTITLKKIVRLIACSLLLMIIFIGGLLLFIIPAFYVITKLQFALMCIVDTDCGVIEAIKKSYHLTTGNFAPLLGLTLLNAFFVATTILMPIAFLMQAYAYRWLQANKPEEVV